MVVSKYYWAQGKVLVFEALNRLGPHYLQDSLSPYQSTLVLILA